MHLRSFIVGGAIALGANAFVVPDFEASDFPPLEVEATEFPSAEESIDFLPVEHQTARQQQIELPCTECPFREVADDGKVSWTDGFVTSLSLNFSVEDGYLLANGRQIFPPPPPARIDAVQRRESDGEETEPIPLGYALEMMPLAAPPDEPGMELLSVRFTVLDLDGHPVPLDTVAITLIHNLEGELFLADMDIEETAMNHGSWRQCSGKPNCLRKLLFDRMRELFSSAKDRMMHMGSKLSGGKKGCHKGPHSKGPHMEGPPHHHHRPGPEGEPVFGAEDGPEHGPHRHHHMHHMHHGGLERTFSRVIRFIVIPAILGVLAGLAASALGMLVGQVVVFLWLRYRRSGSQQSVVNVERGTVSEKQGLMADASDELPPYADEFEDVVDSKN